jgi:Flp pilus assembly protein TadB
MSLTTRILAILLALATTAAGLAIRYGRHESARATQAEQRLALAVQAQEQLQAALEASQRGQEALRGERQAQDTRLRQAEGAAAQARREGEARVQALLMAAPPEPQGGDTRDLVRWATAQAQGLNHRLEHRLEVPR